MTRWIRLGALLVLAGAVVFALHSCSSLDRVSAAEFERALERVNAPESVNDYKPIGVTANRAYIEHWSMVPVFGERITVLWIPIEELPPEVAAKLGASH